MGVDGHRADIVMHKAASTIAAWEGRTEVTRDDVRRAAELALPHRRRRDPFTPPHLDPDELDQAIQSFDASRSASGSDAAEAGMEKRQMSATGEETVAASDQNSGAPTSAGAERQIDPDSIPDSPTLASQERLPMTRPRSGRRTQHEVQGRRGRSVRSRHMKPNDPPDVALLDTIRAAALRGVGDGAPTIQQDDIRIRRRMRKVGNLMLFVVDGSGSMAAQRRMQLTKSAVLSLLADAYQRRDRCGLVTFRKTDAHETVPPTNSLDLAHARMREMPTGGRTPLALGAGPCSPGNPARARAGRRDAPHRDPADGWRGQRRHGAGFRPDRRRDARGATGGAGPDSGAGDRRGPTSRPPEPPARSGEIHDGGTRAPGRAGVGSTHQPDPAGHCLSRPIQPGG